MYYGIERVSYMKKYRVMAFISFLLVCCSLFYAFNVDFWQYRLAVAGLNSLNNLSFNGSLEMNVMVEGEHSFRSPYKFEGTVLNTATESMEFQLNATSVADGIGSVVSMYFNDGITYTATTVSIDGNDVGTEKVRSDKTNMSVLPDSSFFESIDLTVFSRDDFKNGTVTKDDGIYNINVTPDDISRVFVNTLCSMAEAEKSFTKHVLALKKEKYKKLADEYRLDSVSISYRLSKLRFTTFYITGVLNIPESYYYPYDRKIEFRLEVNISPAARDAKLSPPADLQNYLSVGLIYGDNIE